MAKRKCIGLDEHEKWGKDVEHCFICNEKIGKSFKQKLKEKVALVPLEQKQKLIDLLHNGKTVGEAMRESGITDHLVSGEIIMQNIGEIHYLKKEVSL